MASIPAGPAHGRTEASALRLLRALPVWLVVVALVAGVATWAVLQRRAADEAHVRFDLVADAAVRTIEDGLDRVDGAARAAAALRATSTPAQDWERQVEPLGLDPPIAGLRAITALVVVGPAELPGVLDELRRVHGPAVGLTGDPDAERLVVIDRVAPLAPNRDALGLDVRTRPQPRAAVDAALASGSTMMTDPTRLIQDATGPSAVVLYTPSRLDPSRLGSAVVQVQPFVDALAGQFGSSTLRIVDETPDGVEVLATSARHDPAGSRFLATRGLERFGQKWLVEIAARDGFLTQAERFSPAVLGLGVTALVLLAAVAAAGARDREEHALRLVDERTRALEATNTALQQAVAGRDAVLGVVSHELRTPISVIRGFATTLLRPEAGEDPAVRDLAIGRIVDNTERLDGLVTDLLVTARLEGGRERATPVPVDLAAAVEACVADADVGATTETDIEQGATVRVDPGHLDRILHNLLTNAARYGTPPVEITAARVEDAVTVRVADSGPGVPVERRRAIFDRFDRGDAEGDRTQGVGLGLAIVRDLATLNGGSVRYVDRGPDAGACFEVALPAGQIAVAPPLAPPPAHPLATSEHDSETRGVSG